MSAEHKTIAVTIPDRPIEPKTSIRREAETTPAPLDLQVRRILAHYSVSRPLAVVIAVFAFSAGRAR
jgi:hypothetical protein